MEYFITFEDGSEGYLAHYGVKGMKWGRWNSETQARYANAGNGTYYRKASRGDQYSRAVTDQRRAYNANQKKSKQIAKVALMGPLKAHAYNTSRSRGLGRTESLQNAYLGPFYAQGVKSKQRKAGTTQVQLSEPAARRAKSVKDESFAKSAAKTVLLGSTGSVAYDTVKSKTKSSGKAAVHGLLSASAPMVGQAVGRGVGAAAGGLMGNAPGAAVGYTVGGAAGEALGTAASFATQHKAYKNSKTGKGKK